MKLTEVAQRLNVDSDSAYQFAEIMVRLRLANRSDSPSGPTYQFHSSPEKFSNLISSFSRLGVRA